jgi:hypothetical protein
MGRVIGNAGLRNKCQRGYERDPAISKCHGENRNGTVRPIPWGLLQKTLKNVAMIVLSK